MKVISLPEAAERVVVKTASEAFSFAVVTSSIVILGAASSSVIISVAVASLIVELDALDRVIVAVSSNSSSVSDKTGTSNVPEVAPAEIVRVPEVSV